MENKIEFVNGSEILLYKTSSNSKGNRSKLISFYCNNCGIIHEDVLMSEMMIISDNLIMCKTSYEDVIKPYVNI